MTDNKIKETEPVGRYTVLDDHKADVRVTRTTSCNQGSEDNEPVLEFYTATLGYNGGPNLIWRGYDLGAKPYNGYGDSTQAAVLDLLRLVNKQVETRMEAVDLVKILVSEKRQDALSGEVPG